MSDRQSSADLGPKAEAALSAFPFPERDWESDARAVEARLSESARGSTDVSLLAAPLPSEPDEPTSLSATATPSASSGVRTQSLADLARRSVEKKQANERAMVRESLAIAAQQRPSGEEARALREAVSRKAAVAPPSAPSSTRAALAAPESAPSASVATAVAATPRAAPPPSSLPKLALGLPVLALAAAALLWLRRPEPTPLVTNSEAAATEQANPSPSEAAPAITAANARAAVQSAPRGVDPSTLPGESADKPAERAPGKALSSTAKPSASSASPKPNAEKVELEDEEPATAPVAAAEKPVEKALPPDPTLRPADSTGGAVPLKPSSGAVQAALGSVLSGARHCVAGDDGPSSAVVVFASDGHVQSVSVAGPAAGKSSGVCIQAQLSRARVQPFAASNFSVNATVRPD